MSPTQNENIFILLNDKVGRSEFDKEIKGLSDDISSLRQDIKDLKEKDLKELREALLTNQQSGYKRIIYVQGTILLVVAGGIVTLLIKFFG